MPSSKKSYIYFFDKKTKEVMHVESHKKSRFSCPLYLLVPFVYPLVY